MKKLRLTQKAVSIIMSVIIAFAPVWAFAAEITYINDTLSTIKADTVADHTVEFTTPSGVQDNGETITITFDTFTMGSVAAADIDVATSSAACDSSPTFQDNTVAATSGAGQWGAAVAGQILTLTAPSDIATVGTVAANTCIQVQIGTNADAGTNQITNPGSAGDYTVAVKGTFADTGTTTVSILTDDQVQLTADVAQSITFSISDNDQTFGTLTSGGARYASTTGSAAETVAHTLTAGTNASAGYTMTMAGDTLESAAGDTITAIGGTAAASSPGSEQFGVKFGKTGGTGVISSPYDSATDYAWESSSTTPDEIATAAGSTADTVYAATYIANIASDTEAGSYTTAITYVATANF